MTWKAILSRSIGSSHKESGKPCQDWGDLKAIIEKKIIIGAVSDGAGSALYSDQGSHHVVQTIIEYLTETCGQIESDSSEDIEILLRHSIKYTKDKLLQLAQSQNLPFHEFSCTLLVFLSTPSLLVAMQIGDGFIIINREASTDYQLLFSPDKGEYSNSTSFITSSDYLNDLQIKIIDDSADIKFIFLSTDGVERLAATWQDEKWSPYRNFLKPLEEHLFTESDLYVAESQLTDFLESERINSRTDDDKTILICGRVGSTNVDLNYLHDINILSERRERDRQKYPYERNSISSTITSNPKQDNLEKIKEEEKLKSSELDLCLTGNSGIQCHTQKKQAIKHTLQQTGEIIDKNILGDLGKYVRHMYLKRGGQTLLEVVLKVEPSRKKNRNYYINEIGKKILDSSFSILKNLKIDKFKFTFPSGGSTCLTPEELQKCIKDSLYLHLRDLSEILIFVMLIIVLILLITKILRDMILIISLILLVISTLYILFFIKLKF